MGPIDTWGEDSTRDVTQQLAVLQGGGGEARLEFEMKKREVEGPLQMYEGR